MATKKEKVEETPAKETEETPEGLTCSEVAEKINTVLGLQGDDVIDTTLEDDDMKPDILKAAGLVGMDPKTDKFSQKLADKDKADLGDDVWAWLEANEMLAHIPKPEPEKPKTGKAAKEKPAKADKPAGEKKKSNLPVKDFSNSNKAKVFRTWNNGKEMDIAKLVKACDGGVKENTIKAWLGQWKNGKNLPAIANAAK